MRSYISIYVLVRERITIPYLNRYIILFSLLKYPRRIYLPNVQDEVDGHLQKLTQDISNH